MKIDMFFNYSPFSIFATDIGFDHEDQRCLIDHALISKLNSILIVSTAGSSTPF